MACLYFPTGFSSLPPPRFTSPHQRGAPVSWAPAPLQVSRVSAKPTGSADPRAARPSVSSWPVLCDGHIAQRLPRVLRGPSWPVRGYRWPKSVLHEEQKCPSEGEAGLPFLSVIISSLAASSRRAADPALGTDGLDSAIQFGGVLAFPPLPV